MKNLLNDPSLLKDNSPFSSTVLIFSIILVGFLIRIVYYLSNPSLWADEAWVALEIIYIPFHDMLFNPRPDSPTPLGFNILQKTLSIGLGQTDYALRTLSLAASLLGIILFYRMLKLYTTRQTVPWALFLFLFSNSLIYYSVELKPYIVDVFFTLWLYNIAYSARRQELNRRRILQLILIGGGAVWISYPIIFILITIGGSLIFSSLLDKQHKKAFLLFLISLTWAISFSIFYDLGIRSIIASPILNSQWSAGFLAQNNFLTIVAWVTTHFSSFFRSPLGFIFPDIAIAAFIIGATAVFLEYKEKFFLLLGPIVLTLAAGLLRKYPFHERTILFLSPVAFLLIARGITFLLQQNKKHFTVGAVVLMIFLIVPSFSHIHDYLLTPPLKGGLRSVMQQLKPHLRNGDIVYMNNSAQWSFFYYAHTLKLGPTDMIVGLIADESKYKDSLRYTRMFYKRWTWMTNPTDRFLEVSYKKSLRDIDAENLDALPSHPRAWLILSGTNAEQKEFLLDYFNKPGFCIRN